ncbi:uncharacterized protein Dyak_GE28013 [Drosophila yakuba]|uniref:Uncharacterized protein n=1 Tax=Drosophila yakuba TaxID=7245 RepID=A0A0R1DYE1_DROYA|nr:uncharacterized protein Dyak_GE28013 [Drosophila yakuba]
MTPTKSTHLATPQSSQLDFCYGSCWRAELSAGATCFPRMYWWWLWQQRAARQLSSLEAKNGFSSKARFQADGRTFRLAADLIHPVGRKSSTYRKLFNSSPRSVLIFYR